MGSANTPTGPRSRLPVPGQSDPSALTSPPTSGLREQSPHSGTLPDLVPHPSRASPATGDPQSGLTHRAPSLRALLPVFTLPGSRGLPARQQPRSSFTLDFSKAVVLSQIPSPHTFCSTGLHLSPEKTGAPVLSTSLQDTETYLLLLPSKGSAVSAEVPFYPFLCALQPPCLLKHPGSGLSCAFNMSFPSMCLLVF